MSFQFTDNFTSPSGHTLNHALINSGATLDTRSVAADFVQSFASDVFTYDNIVAQFISNSMKQKTQRPTGATAGATFATSTTLSWGNGALAPIASTGGAAISGGKLFLPASNSVESFNPNNLNLVQTGCIRFLYTPNFTGLPSATESCFFCVGADTVSNLIQFGPHAGGGWNINISNSSGTGIVQAPGLGSYSGTAGVEVEVELNFDVTTGATRIFINGVQQGATQLQTGTRSSSLATFTFGHNGDGGNFFIRNVEIFSTVQHTANYTPGYTVPATDYSEALVTFPAFTHALGITGLNSLATTETGGSVGYIVNGKYWNGSAWVTSNNSFAQSGTFAATNTNLPSLMLSMGTTSVTVKVVFMASNTQAGISAYDLNYQGPVYYTDGTVLTQAMLNVQSFIGFTATLSTPTGTAVGFIISEGGVLKYWNGSAWVASDGTYAKSNTMADFNTNLPSLTFAFNETVEIEVVLHTTDTTATPMISQMVLTYDFGGIVTGPRTCLVWGYYRDISGNPVEGATVAVALKRAVGQYIAAASNIIEKAVSTTTDVNGYFEIVLIRTSEYTVGGTYVVVISADGLLTNVVPGASDLELIVPDAVSVDITDKLPTAA